MKVSRKDHRRARRKPKWESSVSSSSPQAQQPSCNISVQTEKAWSPKTDIKLHPFITIQVYISSRDGNDCITSALIDTGCQTNIVTPQHVAQLRMQHLVKSSSVTAAIMANASQSVVQGEIRLSVITVDNKGQQVPYTDRFLVMEIAQAHIILGLPWMKATKATVNPFTMSVEFLKNEAALPPKPVMSSSHGAQNRKDRRVTPHFIKPLSPNSQQLAGERALSPIAVAPSALSTHGTLTVIKNGQRQNSQWSPKAQTGVKRESKKVWPVKKKRTKKSHWDKTRQAVQFVKMTEGRKHVQTWPVHSLTQADHRLRSGERPKSSNGQGRRKAMKQLPKTRTSMPCICHMSFEKDQQFLCSWKTFSKHLRNEKESFQTGSALMGVLYPQQPESMTTQCNLVHVSKDTQVQLSEEEAARQRDISQVLKEYEILFEEPTGLPPSRHITHKIQLTADAKPVRRAPYRLALTEQQELQKQLKELLDKGFICPSHSNYASPCLFVKKKDGTFRMCCDYRALNSQTVKSQYPLPRIEDILDQLGSARYFSKLDLASGYHQIMMDPESAYLSAIQTRFGLYEWKVMPFGLTNAPSTFQQCMDATLEGLLGDGVADYLDDIIIYSEEWQEHLRKLRLVFDRLLQHQFKVKLKKCEFGKLETTYLGHTLKGGQIAVQDDKVQAVSELAVPTTIRQLRSFLGACNYYRRFIKDYAKIAKPLTQLLKKDTLYVWTKDRQDAFDVLRTALVTAPILKVPDPAKEFILWCDASDYALGAVLAQEADEGKSKATGQMLQPVAYLSHTFSDTQMRYPIRDKELMAAIIPLNKWRHYLYGKHFYVYTDHKSLTSLYTQKELTGRPARWLDKFQEYDFDVCYKQGAQQFVPDMLSRYPRRIIDGPWQAETSVTLNAPKRVTFCNPLTMQTRSVDVPLTREQLARRQAVMNAELTVDPVSQSTEEAEYLPSGPSAQGDLRVRQSRKQQQPEASGTLDSSGLAWSAIADNTLYLDLQEASSKDDQVRQLMSLVRQGRSTDRDMPNKEFGVENQLLYVRKPNGIWKIWVPRDEAVRKVILNELHDAPLAGHPGIVRTIQRVEREYYWPGMNKDISTYVNTCPSCQRNKRDYGKKHGLLQPIPAPTERWQSIALDFVGPLSMSRKGNNFLLVVVDRFTHRCVLIPTTSSVSAAQTATLLIDNVIKLFGFPEAILSDRDTRFTSQIWTELMKRLGIKIRMTTAYHPQTDGQVERLNQEVAQYLRHYVGRNPTTWDEHVSQAEMALNTNVTRATGYTPFYADTGREMHTPGQITPKGRSQQLVNPHMVLQKVIEDLHEAHTDMVVNAARAKATMKKQADKHRKPVTFQVGQQVWLSTRNLQLRKRNRKFAPRWIGPYSITHVPGPVNVTLNLPENAGIDSTFHVDMVKRYQKPSDEERLMEYAGPEDLLEEAQYEVDRIVSQRASEFGTEYLVKWVDFPDNARHNSWLTLEELSSAPQVIADWQHLKSLHPTRQHEDMLFS